jgi:hypothetical protein
MLTAHQVKAGNQETPDSIRTTFRVGNFVTTPKSAGDLFPPKGDRAVNAPVDMAAHRAGADRRLAVIDCDVHPYPKRGSLNQ